MSNNIAGHGIFTTDRRHVASAEELCRREIREARPGRWPALAACQQKQYRQYNRTPSSELQQRQQRQQQPEPQQRYYNNLAVVILPPPMLIVAKEEKEKNNINILDGDGDPHMNEAWKHEIDDNEERTNGSRRRSLGMVL